MADKPTPTPLPRGRLRRLGRVMGLSARVGSGMLGGKMKRLLGGDLDPRVEAARRVLLTLGEMKGVALKLGQTLSLGAADLPPEIRNIVSEMFSKVPSLHYDDIAAVIAAELGAAPDTLFCEFAKEPFAAASLGQVHRARLKTGEPVAVKVQYPNVGGALEEDLNNAGAVVRALGLGTNLLDSKTYFEEVRREVLAELDYLHEAKNLEAFRSYVAPWPGLVVPKVFRELSTSRVLVLEYFDGPTLSEYSKGIDHVDPKERFRLARLLIQAVYGPFLVHQVIQTDTHPGNFVVCNDGRLGLFDFGSVKTFSKSFWRCYVQAIGGGLDGGHVSLLPLLKDGGFSVSLSDERAEFLLHDLARIVGRPLVGAYDFAHDKMTEDLRAFSLRHAHELVRIRPPAEAILFYRAVAGMAYNMRLLKAAGDFRPTFAELVAAGSAQNCLTPS